MEKITEKEILKIITKKRFLEKSFSDTIKSFDQKLSNLVLPKNIINISNYFGKGFGLASARTKLLQDGIIKSEWLTNGNTTTDFKGIYIFFHNDKPFYVGISKQVLRRILQHTKGHSHYTSTLAYNIGLIYYKLKNGVEYKGKREDFDFSANVEPIKEFLSKQKLVIMNIENDDELYLFEIYCAMRLQTVLNKFETH